MLQHVGSRTHHRHVSDEHIDELRKFVDVRPSHEFAHPGLPRVVARGLQFVAVGVHTHGAELQTVEHLAVQAAPLLPEEDGARTGELDERSEHQQHNGEDEDNNPQREEDVESTLQPTVADERQGLVVEREHGKSCQDFH